VVNVGVREDHCFDFAGIKGKVEIDKVRFITFALKSTAIDQKFVSMMFDQMH